jgi:hypothetical protein
MGFETLGITAYYGLPTSVGAVEKALVVVPCAPDSWSAVVRLATGRLDRLSLAEALPAGRRLPLEDPVPILFWGAGRLRPTRFAEITERGSLVVWCDIVAATLFLLSRWEETQISVRDEHDRMPVTESVAFRQGFLDRPLVDEYAMILREWLEVLLPNWTPRRQRFRVKVSHDIDLVWPFRRLRGAAGAVARDLLRKRPRQTAGTAALAMKQLVAPRRTPYYRGIGRLAEISTRHGFQSAFYFMAADASRYDSGYDPTSPAIRDCIAGLREQGCEIGFHAGYRTLGDPALLAAEKSKLEGILGTTRFGGRQHFLRFRVPDTWRDWESAGLSYDSTLSFADREGFRCGTCHAYRPFDAQRDRELDVWELPLIVMDGTLRQYRELSPAAARQRVRELADRCRAVEGTFTLLWHNSLVDGEWGRAFEGMVSDLAGTAEKASLPEPGAPSGRTRRNASGEFVRAEPT